MINEKNHRTADGESKRKMEDRNKSEAGREKEGKERGEGGKEKKEKGGKWWHMRPLGVPFS